MGYWACFVCNVSGEGDDYLGHAGSPEHRAAMARRPRPMTRQETDYIPER